MPVSVSSLWWYEALNSAHALVFIYISIFVFSRLSISLPALHRYRLYIITIVSGLFIGLSVEVLQFFVGREMSLQDWSKDFFGLLSGIALLEFRRQIKSSSFNKAAAISLLFAAGFLFFGVHSLLQLSWHYYQRNNAFPVLLEFDKSWSDSFLFFNKAEVTGGAAVFHGGADKFYRIVFESGRYPGFGLVETAGDWSNYRYLCFSLFSSQHDDVDVVLRVNDSAHNQEYTDRYNKRISVHYGVNKIKVALIDIKNAAEKRNINLSEIAEMKLFAVNLEKAVEFEISNIELQ